MLELQPTHYTMHVSCRFPCRPSDTVHLAIYSCSQQLDVGNEAKA